MSRKKHNVSYIKPDEPKFLREMKERVGYKEGPTVDTKREVLPQGSDDDVDDRDEEKPTVVVLNPGDLTAKEAETFQRKKEEDEANAPADLSKRIIFKKNKIKETDSNAADKPAKKKSKKSKQEKAIVSFDDNDDDYL